MMYLPGSSAQSAVSIPRKQGQMLYNTEGVQKSLGQLSPIEFRKKLAV